MSPSIKSYFSIFREAGLYLRATRRWWMAPILFVLLFFGLFILVVETSTLLPFFYALF